MPAWAIMQALCGGQPSSFEALVHDNGSPNPELIDVTDLNHIHYLCSINGNEQESAQIVNQTTISWAATQGSPSAPGASLIAVLNLFTGASTVVASWTGGAFMDGLHAWSPDRGFLAYVASDPSSVQLHLLSGGGDRVVATLGPVLGRGINPNEDDAYLAFSPDGAYFALVQTFTSSGDQLQVRRTIDGSLAFNLGKGTMATWGSTGSKLYYRLPNSTQVQAWDSASGVSQPMSQPQAWIHPRADAGDDNLAFTVRDANGAPHVWLYGHGGRSGGELPNFRSSPVWLNTTSLFYVEEAVCTSNCIGPTWLPDGKTFVFDVGTQTETPYPAIRSVLSTWPRPGQI